MGFSSIAKNAWFILVPVALALSLAGCGSSSVNQVTGATTPPSVSSAELQFSPTSAPVVESTPGPVIVPASSETAGSPIPILETGWGGRLPPPGNLLRTPATCEGLRDFFEPRFQGREFHTVITDTTLPLYTPLLLRTDSWISYVPELSNLYPGDIMFIEIYPYSNIDYSVCPPVIPIRLEIFTDAQGLRNPAIYFLGHFELQPDRPHHPDYPYFFLKRKGGWRLIETFVGPIWPNILDFELDFFTCHSHLQSVSPRPWPRN